MRTILFSLLFLVINFSQDVKTLAKSPLINDGMFVGKSGTIYTTVGGLRGGTQVGKVTPTGDVSVLSDGFSGTIDVYTDDENLFYTTNYDDNTLKTFDQKTGDVKTITTELDGPASIAIGKDGFLYVTNFGAPPSYSGHTITRINPKNGDKSNFIDSRLLFRPQGIIYDSGYFYVVNTPGGRIFRIKESDKSIENFTMIGAPIGNIAKKGNLFFGSSNRTNQIYVIDMNGNYMTLSGDGTPETKDGSFETARFLSPLGLALSRDNNTLYVAQAMDGSLRAISIKNYQMDLKSELSKNGVSITISENQLQLENKTKFETIQFTGMDGKELKNLASQVTTGKTTLSTNDIVKPCLLSFKLNAKRFGIMISK